MSSSELLSPELTLSEMVSCESAELMLFVMVSCGSPELMLFVMVFCESPELMLFEMVSCESSSDEPSSDFEVSSALELEVWGVFSSQMSVPVRFECCVFTYTQIGALLLRFPPITRPGL